MQAINERFLEDVGDTRDERLAVRRKVAEGRWTLAESDPHRIAAYLDRRIAAVGESHQGPTNDLQRADFLEIGARVRRAVARVEVVSAGKGETGSGFLISRDLFLTNQHVIENMDAARGARITFDDEIVGGGYRTTTVYRLDPDRLALFCAIDDLDYAVVAMGPKEAGPASLDEFGFCPLSNTPDRHALGMNVNIIQHPGGRPKMIAVRNNLLSARTKRTLLYETDTETGSSGSPVFNDDWDVIALHHFGHPFLETVDDTGAEIPTAVNEGVRISAIYEHLAARIGELEPNGQALLRAALETTVASPPDQGRRLSPARRSSTGESLIQPVQGSTMRDPSPTELKITLPLEITVRLGDAGSLAAASPLPESRQLQRGAEKMSIDRDYRDRSGYLADFIDGVDLPLPKPDEKLSEQVAPVKDPAPNAQPGELRYEHFSVVLHKARRLAIFTATNIDGPTYLAINRETGRPSADGGEGETWYKDPRISSSFTVEQPFYSAWSDYFDRGHLTRRTDVTWGAADVSMRANADTYHFTNCTPQHFRFNQSAIYWQGAERYVLEKGALTKGDAERLTVFQGPIFNDTIDRWADDLQIPSSFFKIIIWKSRGGLKSVGLVVDQLPLMDERRTQVGRPNEAAPVTVNQWRVAITAIEERTGLDFGEPVRSADTIGSGVQPRVGESQKLILSLDDILA